MKSTWSRIARGGFAAAIVASLAVLACTCRHGVETDLYALLDQARRSVLRALADNLGGQLRILLEGPDFASIDVPAAEFKAFVGPHAQETSGSIRETLMAIAPHSAGLITEETRKQLQAGEFDAVAKSSATALVSGFLTPLVSVKQDPYLLATDYLTHLQARDDHGWTIRDGDPVCEMYGRCYRLLVFDGFTTSDSAFVCEVVNKIREFNAAGSTVSAYASGAPFHASIAMENSKREINVLSAVSLVVVFVLGWGLFRSVRFVVPLGVTIVSAFLAATASVFAVFDKPHMLTFVFGTSLIGLGVDYVYHAYAAEDVRSVRRPLTYALITTIACFAPLSFSSVAVLRQMALFTSVGLVTAWACVLVWRPGGSGVSPLRRPGSGSPGGIGVSPLLRAVLPLSLLLLSVGAFRIRLSSDPSNFYRPDPLLAAGEKKFYELNQAAASRFMVVEGATMQEALEREETAGAKGLSSIIPSLKRQRENRALVAALREKTGSAYTAMTGVPVARDGVVRGGDEGLLDPETITDPLLVKMMHPMCVRTADRVLLVSPYGGRSGETPLPPWVAIVEPKRVVMEMFDAYAKEAYRLLGISFAVLVVLLAMLFRRRFLACVWPVAAASAATLGVLGWCGVQLTFFHALCFFVFTGLGLDYAIFHLGNPSPRTRQIVLVSFLTSCAAFGMLAFTDFAVTRAMGVTLAVGLLFAYLFASAGGACKPAPGAETPVGGENVRGPA